LFAIKAGISIMFFFKIFFSSAFQLVKQVVLPRVHGLALKTTVAAVCWYFV